MALRHALFLALLVTCSAATGHSGLPGERLSKLRELLSSEPHPIRILETHSGLTGLIAETADVGGKQFHGLWSSSLTSSALRGKPDIETVDTTARLAIVTETLSVTTKPMIYDADTGGHPEIFKFTVRALEQLGVSACIIEDKTGLKQNSLFGTERTQTLDDIPAFCEKIKAGREARQTEEFMVIARIEALIAGFGMDEALKRGLAYAAAGADALMIHSKQKSPDEVLEFIKRYKEMAGAKAVPIVVVPSSYNTITEAELGEAGASICIYANHMLRAAYPAMRKVAESILTHGRSSEADADVLPIKKVIELIDEDPAAAASGALKLSGGAADQAAADQLAGHD